MTTSFVEKYGTSTNNAAYSSSYGFTFGYDPFGEVKRQIPAYSSNLSIFDTMQPLGTLPSAPKATPQSTSNSSSDDIFMILAATMVAKALNNSEKTSSSTESTGSTTQSTPPAENPPQTPPPDGDGGNTPMNALSASKILLKYYDNYQTLTAGDGAALASWSDIESYAKDNPEMTDLAEALEYFSNNKHEFHKMEVMGEADDKKSNYDNNFLKKELVNYIGDLEAEAEDDDE